MRRVVVTGMGIWSCLGKNQEEVAASLREGRSGIGIDSQRIEYGYRSPLTGIVEKPQLKGILDRKLRMYLAEEGEYAYMATLEAFKQAGVDDAYLMENEEVCCLVTTLQPRRSSIRMRPYWRKKTPPSSVRRPSSSR